MKYFHREQKIIMSVFCPFHFTYLAGNPIANLLEKESQGEHLEN